MNNLEFVKILENIAKNYKTLYVMGCIGNNMTEKNKIRYTNNHPYNKKASRVKMIKAADENTWGFDCVCLIKSVLWGWKGDKNASYGGAKYLSNNVPDINADTMITKCLDLSEDFTDVKVGEAVWLKGHIGVYIGNGLCVECTPSWQNGVQITACNKNIDGYKKRTWKKHGKLPYIFYKNNLEEIAYQVISGKFGNGQARRKNLESLGYNYSEVQSLVNSILKKDSLEKVANDVILGKYGNGKTRKENLEKAGYDYRTVQNEVNRILKENQNAR